MAKSSRGQDKLDWLRYIFWLLVPLLLWWSFRSLELSQIILTLSRITWWQALLLILTNSSIIFLFGVRWRLLIRHTHPSLSANQLAGYWLAGFAVDYSTPAPGVGGEPFLALILHRRQKMEPSTATAAVGLDRLFDAAFNATVLTTFALLVLHWQILHHHLAIRAALLPGLILLLIVSFLIPVFLGQRPFNWLANKLPEAWQDNRLINFLRQSEIQFGQLIKNQKFGLMLAFFISCLSWIAILFEFWLLVSFLGIELDIRQLITAVTASRLAFLFPLPAGLGALEASLVFAFRLMGLEPAVGIGAALIVRVRDVLFISAGLIWGSSLLGGWSNLRQSLGEAATAIKQKKLD